MDSTQAPLEWSASYDLADINSTTSLPGDKILLPSSALQQLLATSPQLPHPLTFRLVNPDNDRVVYAGVREFSAEEGHATLSSFLEHALDVNNKLSPKITIHAKQLSKGTYVKIRPLDAGYDPEDWKSLLEDHLRRNFTTLTRGEILDIPAGHLTGSLSTQHFRFLIDEFMPSGEAICVVDTDLEVDIEALNEEQARETLRILDLKRQKAQNTKEGTSAGGEIRLTKDVNGQILPGSHVDYELPSWDRSRDVNVILEVDNDEGLDLFVSPFSAQQRNRPRSDEHVYADFEPRSRKRLRIASQHLQDAEAIWVTVQAPQVDAISTTPTSYTIRLDPYSPLKTDSHQIEPTSSEKERTCANCHQAVPAQSFNLHRNFCERNNILCPHGCGRVFPKRSSTFQTHWHCPHDASSGDTTSSLARHNEVFHKTYHCPSGPHDPVETFSSLPELAIHRTTKCPEKPINCRFCHLTVPQGARNGVEAEVFMSGLAPHEIEDGARTNECYICGHMVRLRSMESHMKNHDFEKAFKLEPRICLNVNCGNVVKGNDNDVQLCYPCFGPLYNSLYDPQGKALARRIERRYLTQLTRGCGKQWCLNRLCHHGRQHLENVSGKGLTLREALPMVQPYAQGLGASTAQYFCVDESCQARRKSADMLQAEARTNPMMKEYAFGWYVAALEETKDLDSAREWLSRMAPSLDETKHR